MIFILQKVKDVKHSFVRFISHEIRSPLNVMSLGLDMLKKEMSEVDTKTETVALVKDMKESCEHSMTILNELLNLDMIEAGILDLDRTWVCGWHAIKEFTGPLISQVFYVFISYCFYIAHCCGILI